MGRPAGWVQKLTGRGAMRSPGAPSLRCEIERKFWDQIATGITSEKAAEAVGVSQAVGSRCGTCFTLTKQPPRFPVRFTRNAEHDSAYLLA